ncbi:hypothetical protein FB451DRAFT_1412077 [Mycena latifolia]|nr:hypothetical protein FB451DRAFT_1412077 [Mycena latifolia]
MRVECRVLQRGRAATRGVGDAPGTRLPIEALVDPALLSARLCTDLRLHLMLLYLAPPYAVRMRACARLSSRCTSCGYPPPSRPLAGEPRASHRCTRAAIVPAGVCVYLVRLSGSRTRACPSCACTSRSYPRARPSRGIYASLHVMHLHLPLRLRRPRLSGCISRF